MDTIINQVISRSLVCVWVTGIAFPPNWTTLPHGQHMYTWSPASWKSGQPSTTRLCHTLDNHPHNHPLAGQKHIKLPALMSVGILGNDYYWIDGKRCITITPAVKRSTPIAHARLSRHIEALSHVSNACLSVIVELSNDIPLMWQPLSGLQRVVRSAVRSRCIWDEGIYLTSFGPVSLCAARSLEGGPSVTIVPQTTWRIYSFDW